MFTDWTVFDSQLAALDELRRRFDRMFEDVGAGVTARPTAGAWPRVNLYDSGAAFVVTAEVPGVADADLQLSVTRDGLTIAGERKVLAPEGYSAHRRERAPLRFSRALSFPMPVDSANASAELKNGVLKVTLPKAPEAQPRTISVKVS